MIVKSKPSFISGDDFLGALVVATTLLSQIAVSDNQGGACYNPAVALAQLTFGIAQATGDLKDSMIHYFWIFLVIPFFGGAFAGFMSHYHEQACRTMKEYDGKSEGGS